MTVQVSSIAPPVEERRSTMASLRATTVGNVLEWFDWSIYATFSPFIAKALFAPSDPVSALLQTLAIFTVGFLARPIGGIYFGKMAGVKGRQHTLVVTMVLMGFGSLVLALTPAYATIGAVASVWLLVARLIQGFAHGGETSASFVYLGELAPPGRRGLWSSTVFVSSTIGVVLGSLTGVLLTQVLDAQSLSSWGWRIPFVIGALLAIYAYWLRSRSVETDSFLEAKKEIGIAPQTVMSRRALIAQAFRLATLVGATSVAYYTWLSFATSYAITIKGVPAQGAFIASLCAQLICIAVMPAFGALSDRIGRRPLALLTTVGFAIASFPLDSMFTNSAWSLFFVQSIALVLWGSVGAIYPAMMVEQFPTGSRALVIGITYSVATVIFGGTAPYLNTWLSSIGLHWVFTAYTVTLCVLPSISVFTMKETAGLNLTTMSHGKT